MCAQDLAKESSSKPSKRAVFGGSRYQHTEEGDEYERSSRKVEKKKKRYDSSDDDSDDEAVQEAKVRDIMTECQVISVSLGLSLVCILTTATGHGESEGWVGKEHSRRDAGDIATWR